MIMINVLIMINDINHNNDNDSNYPSLQTLSFFLVVKVLLPLRDLLLILLINFTLKIIILLLLLLLLYMNKIFF